MKFLLFTFAILGILTAVNGQVPGSVKSFYKADVDVNSTLADSPNLYWFYAGGGAVMVNDVDGDGISDVIITSTSQSSHKLLHQLRLTSSGKPKAGHRYTDIDALPKTATNSQSDLGVFGVFAMDNIGDLNGDGVDDIVIGNSNGGASASSGEFYLAYPNRSGTLDSIRQFRSQNWSINAPLVSKGFFGNSVANIGDLDGDGVNDIAVGQQNVNAIWIVFLTRQGLVKSSSRITSGSSNFTTLEPNTAFGTGICGIGDLDGDHIPDIVAVSPDTNARGSIWTLFMNRDGSVKDYKRIKTSESPLFADTVAKNTLFGISVARIGDLDGDGVPDIAVGEPYAKDTSGTQIGRVHILMMNRDGTIKSRMVIDRNTTPFQGALPIRTAFGMNVFRTGDFNKDGVPDLGVSIPEARYLIPYGPIGANTSGLFFILNLNGVPVTTGVGDLIVNNGSELSVFPNPTSNQLIVGTKRNAVKILRLIVTDINGRMIHNISVTGDQAVIDVSKWSAGIYSVTTVTSAETYTSKFIKR